MKVWVTRSEQSDGPLCKALVAAGLEPVLEPVIEREVITDGSDVISTLMSSDWLVLTSPFAVESVALEPSRIPQVAVVGESSESIAEDRGFRVKLVSSGGNAASLFEELLKIVKTETVCYPRSTLTKAPDVPSSINLISFELYKTTARAFDKDKLADVSIIAVTSPSAARIVVKHDNPIASIGSTTSAELRAHGIEPAVESAKPDFQSLAQAIADYLYRSRHLRA